MSADKNNQLSFFTKQEYKEMKVEPPKQSESKPQKPKIIEIIICPRCQQKRDSKETPFWAAWCVFCWEPHEQMEAWRCWWSHQFGALERAPEDFKGQWWFGIAPSHYQKARKQARLLKEALKGNFIETLPAALKALSLFTTIGADKVLMAGWKSYLIERLKEQVETDLKQQKIFKEK
jgi:hypothetical protein